ncbi:MAG: hypothetical protein ACRCX2_28445, partial [Paraclostridium sp.]
MTNYIFQDLKTNVPNCKLEERVLQGTTNRTFAFTLFDRAKQALLSPTAEISVVVLYDPKVVNGSVTFAGSYVMDKNNPGYNITTRETQIDEKFTIVYVPFVEEYVTYAGNCELILQIKEGDVLTYTYGMYYTVDKNDAYFKTSIPNNLPTFTTLAKKVQLISEEKAEKDLSNISNQDFKNKAVTSGASKIYTGDDIVTMLQTQPAIKKLDYNTGLKNTPSIPVIPTAQQNAMGLNALTGDDRVDYNAIKNAPSIPSIPTVSDTIKEIEKQTGDDRLDISTLKGYDGLADDTL